MADIPSKTNKKKQFSKTNIIFLMMFVLLTFIDQMTKYMAARFLRDGDISLIPNVLELHYLENRGAAWGILQGQTWLLTGITIFVLVVIGLAFLKVPCEKRFRLLRIGMVMLAAGAVGNLIDRILKQYVIDFIYFVPIDFPVFNAADCFVCISAVLILYCVLFKYKEDDFTKCKQNET